MAAIPFNLLVNANCASHGVQKTQCAYTLLITSTNYKLARLLKKVGGGVPVDAIRPLEGRAPNTSSMPAVMENVDFSERLAVAPAVQRDNPRDKHELRCAKTGSDRGKFHSGGHWPPARGVVFPAALRSCYS